VTIEKFVEYLKGFKPNTKVFPISETDDSETIEQTNMVSGEYWYYPVEKSKFPFKDFTKTIGAPGTLDHLPEGGIGIYTDDNFWPLAFLPYEYKDIDIKDLVEVLWPHLTEGAIYSEDYIEQNYSFPLTTGE
jgi:hypothetical protein